MRSLVRCVEGRKQLQTRNVAVGSGHRYGELVERIVGPESRVERYRTDPVVQHGIERMDLAAVEERGVQVVLPLEILRGRGPNT